MGFQFAEGLLDRIKVRRIFGKISQYCTHSFNKLSHVTSPILVPDGAGIWTFGDHLRHLAGHAGTIPLARDEFGRCVICLRRWAPAGRSYAAVKRTALG